MVSLAHISDVHLAPLPRVRFADLMNKRLTGYLNWQLNRRGHMHSDTLSNLVSHMKAQSPDLTAVTGDLVNLALDTEFAHAGEWIQTLGPPQNVCAIAGNHDVYVQGALDKFQQAMGRYASGDLIDKQPYPYVRRFERVALVCCNSAVATSPFNAYGVFDAEQQERLIRCLDLLDQAKFFRVVMIHHPPNVEFSEDKRRGLRGAELMREAIAEKGAELVLHGHIHRSTMHAMDGPNGEVPVIGVAAGSADAASGEDPARYNLFDIRRSRSSWHCNMREFGYQRIGDEIVERLNMRIF